VTHRRFARKTREAVASASDHGPTLSDWLGRIEALGDDDLSTAIEGMWCGRSGRVTLDMAGTTSCLCMGWYESHVEYSYIS
jgi:hypothetical protein